ncbi:DUF6249 domain-containing protein [Mucilaginibacter sp. McL0603]|uniref:DUF6249 domain-containing protein n=1 Tax=Mucilaginibacter sp. McL0603 TaxID=3415670 RepID=UPI003CF69F68
MNNLDTPEFGMMTGILICLGFFAMVFGIVYLYKRERMAMIERGMDPRRYKPRSAPYPILKWALLLMGAGVGLLLANILSRTLLKTADYDDDNVAIYFALIAIFGGLGLFASYRIEKKEISDNPEQE